MKARPIYDKILIRRTKPPEVTQGGIIIPKTTRDESVPQGEVLAVGEGRPMPDGVLKPLLVKPGMIVLFQPHAAQVIKVEGESLIVLAEHDVLAIMEPT